MSNIILLEDYKDFHNITNPNNDAKLAYVIDFVNNLVKGYCRTEFVPTTVVAQKATSINGIEIFLFSPLISVEELRFGTTVIDPTAYHVNNELGLIESLDDSFSTSKYVYEVDYTYGFAEAPSDLKMATLDLALHWNNREFTKSKSIGGQNVDYGDTSLIPSHIRNVLNQYRVL